MDAVGAAMKVVLPTRAWLHDRCRTFFLGLLLLSLLLQDLAVPTLTQAVTHVPPVTLNDPASPQTSVPLYSTTGSGEAETTKPLATGATGLKPQGDGLCRDRMGLFAPADFALWTCGFCLKYLYVGKPISVFFHAHHRLVVFTNATRFPVDSVLPDVDNATFVGKVCDALEKADQDCQRWLSCCRAARACCQRQLSLATTPTPGELGGRRSLGLGVPGAEVEEGGGDGVAGDSGYCPATWDGYSCWDASRAGSTVSSHCAGYIEHASTDALAHKVCQENGTWFVSPESNQEWTDYTGCIVMDHYWALFWVGVACNLISLVLLVPACFIFLYFRSLRSQHRIKLHTCLFISYVITNVLMVMWEFIVVKDRLTSTNKGDSVLHQNSVGCRVLHTLTRYAWTTNFMWMFLEGFHLYRLMVHAFAVPRSLLGFYIGGFSIPWIPTIIYISIRATRTDLNTRCWVGNAGAFEWFIYTPIIFFLVGNVLFLVKIMHVMLTQLQSHPNEPSSYRRAAKAAAILVPLFGLQVVMVIFRPQPANDTFEIISKIITNTQGALVAIGFCYLNGEVLTVIRNSLPHSLRSRSLLRSDQRSTMSTQFTTDAGSRSTAARPSVPGPAASYGGSQAGGAGYIPLSTLGDDSRNKGNGEAEKLHNGFV